jgi:hypothetical protein
MRASSTAAVVAMMRRRRYGAAQATREPIVARHVPDPQSAAAHAQLSVAQPAGRASHAYDTAQPPRQPGGPPSGQLGVELVPAGQLPPSATGVQTIVAQFCSLTQS